MKLLKRLLGGRPRPAPSRREIEPSCPAVDWDPPRDPEPGEPRLKWRLSEPTPLPRTAGRAEPWSREKALAEISRCPSCKATGRFRWAAGSITCQNCQATFRRAGNGVVDFITADAARGANLQATDAVSRHTYDVAAREIIDHVRERGGTVLDCGAGAHDRWWDNVVRIEIEPYDFTDFLAVNQELPFRDDAFDAVFSLNVLEHVNDPFLCAREIVRVLKPGGIAYVVVPFLQPLHGYPDHYYNMTASGLRTLFRSVGDVEMQFIPAAGQPIFSLSWMLRSYVAGLDEATARQFSGMTVAEILATDPVGHLDRPFVRGLSEAARRELASTTAAFVRKPD